MEDKQAKARPFPFPFVLMGIGGLLIIAMLAVGAVVNSPRPTPTPTSKVLPLVERISVENSYQAFQNQQVVFLDVRDLLSYEESHIAGAVHIPLNQLADRLTELHRGSWIITYCT